MFPGGPGRGGRYRHGGALGRSATLGVMVAAERSPDDLRFFERCAHAEGPATLFKRTCCIGWTLVMNGSLRSRSQSVREPSPSVRAHAMHRAGWPS